MVNDGVAFQLYIEFLEIICFLLKSKRLLIIRNKFS